MRITKEQEDILKNLAKTPYGIALQAFLDIKYSEINNIMTSKSWEETLGRQFALNVLKDLFMFMGTQNVDSPGKKNQYE